METLNAPVSVPSSIGRDEVTATIVTVAYDVFLYVNYQLNKYITVYRRYRLSLRLSGLRARVERYSS